VGGERGGNARVDLGIERETLLVVEDFDADIKTGLSEGCLPWRDDENFVGRYD
jgi:hypothetical protein